ncbi:AAA family ATPase [Streptomyces prasinus]|uniref:AAA family ATPase n=1 Tax=Streptomyces prasinus TaxID=67345 RepID=UPI0037D38471
MKIVSLTFSGLRSYPGTCGPLDFTGKSLVGILGDTGAGKTSLLEAITAGLYGRCSWTDRAAQLRADDSPTMMIDLTFAVDGRQWRVHRVFHETRPTQARLTGPDNKNIDGVRAVDDAIRSLIGIDYATFHSSVLIPQGRFGELLNANDAERTRILKSIFGVEELHRVRQLALEAASQLNELLHQAERENDRLHEDPRAQAVNARERHDQALGGAADLDNRRSQLRRLRIEAARAKQHARLSAGAAAALQERRISDYHRTTEAVQQAQAELQHLEDKNAAAESTAQTDLETVTSQQNEADSAGLAAAALAAAAQVLSDVPRRLTSLEQEESAHTRLLAELETEEEALSRRAADLDDEDRRADALHSRVRDGEDEAADAGETLQMLTDAVRAGVEAAGSLAQQRAAQAATDHKLTALLQAPPADTPDTARTELRRAQGMLEDIRRREAAHAAGSGLVAGDGCPVCVQPLPGDYRPPQPQDADTLARAQTAVEAAMAALTAVEREHTRHTHEVELLRAALSEHRRKVQQATDRLQAALPPLHAHTLRLAAQTAHPQSATYAKEVEDTAAAALFALADPTTPADYREAALHALLGEPRDRVTQLQETVAAGRAELTQAETALAAERASLTADTRAADRSRTQAQQAQHRLTEGRLSVLASLSALPGPIRAHLPQQPDLPTAHDLEAATQAVRQEQDRHEELAERHTQLRTLLQSLLAEREKLAERRRCEVTEPLHRLEAGLHRWADSARSAAELIEEEQRPALPRPHGTGDATATQEYAAALETVTPRLLESLDEHETAARAAMAELAAQLAVHADALAAAYPDIAAALVAPGTDPLDPELLDGLTSQAGTLRSEADRALREEQDALSQIPHKDRLMAAIDAGQHQKAAWQTLAAHLTDGKFPGHLTDLRTRALLAHGSELLQQLSGGRLGFADNFDIVNLASHNRRSSRTLSGGETFQASLALSLALMEMHSRSGTRLESLFLDEGFGTLDTAALDSALQVLRTQVGPDKLLAVISHLRPVAETVNDVLWVEKDHRGSRARWLTAAERDSLLRDDLHNLADPA